MRLAARSALCALLFGSACAAESASDPGPDGGPGGSDGGAGRGDGGAPGECRPLPDPGPSWLGAYQEEIVARLSGHEPLEPGVTLADRATPSRRRAARDFLEGRFADLGLEPRVHDYGSGANVYALLEATEETDLHLLLGAHYDSWSQSPGANDNATGVAAVLAAARHLQEVPCRRAHVYFALFDEEEIGLVGSEAFAAMLDDREVALHSAHTIDQNGWDEDGDRAVELERADPGLTELYQAAKADLALDVPLRPTQTGQTDHVSFRDHGYPAVGLTEEFVSGDTTPHYHQPTDTFETVDFDYLASTSALLSHTFALFLTGD